jgi:2-polyprenyl-3-methyl-5-hydroxy-6-metoxy-1,4-benzoquinol methylase
MEEIAPGSILQRMYFKKRIARLKPKRFCEIGSGNGILSAILLHNGYTGIGFDLNAEACRNNLQRNSRFVEEGHYKVINEDFLSFPHTEKYDLIFSSMVIEHLDEKQVEAYFTSCRKLLNKAGTIAIFVPSSKKHWGIEDEIAGHYKRYEFEDLKTIAKEYGLRITDLSGLTFPLSNWLLGLSNRLVAKNEGYKKNLSMQEQTILSGNRGTPFKTVFPWYLKIFLNQWVLYPFYVLQRLYKNHTGNLVVYCEYTLA